MEDLPPSFLPSLHPFFPPTVRPRPTERLLQPHAKDMGFQLHGATHIDGETNLVAHDLYFVFK